MSAEVASLTTNLASPDTATRLAAAEGLCGLGEDCRSAAVALVRAVADDDEEVCEAVCATLEELGPPQTEQVAELSTLLGDANADVGYWAATLLGRLGAEAAPASEALGGVLGSAAETNVQQRAAWALGKIGPAAEDALEALESATENSDARLARLAAEAVAAIRNA